MALFLPRDVGVLGAELLHQKLLGVWGDFKYGIKKPQTSVILGNSVSKNAGKLSFLGIFKDILTKVCHMD